MMVITLASSKFYTKDSIKQACLLENQAHFNQASDTPLLQPSSIDFWVHWEQVLLLWQFSMASFNTLRTQSSKIPSMHFITMIPLILLGQCK